MFVRKEYFPVFTGRSLMAFCRAGVALFPFRNWYYTFCLAEVSVKPPHVCDLYHHSAVMYHIACKKNNCHNVWISHKRPYRRVSFFKLSLKQNSVTVNFSLIITGTRTPVVQETCPAVRCIDKWGQINIQDTFWLGSWKGTWTIKSSSCLLGSS